MSLSYQNKIVRVLLTHIPLVLFVALVSQPILLQMQKYLSNFLVCWNSQLQDLFTVLDVDRMGLGPHRRQLLLVDLNTSLKTHNSNLVLPDLFINLLQRVVCQLIVEVDVVARDFEEDSQVEEVGAVLVVEVG